MSTDPRLEAADICDRAHDILMRTGIHCYQTIVEDASRLLGDTRHGYWDGPGFVPTAVPDDELEDVGRVCLWQGVAMAVGLNPCYWGEVETAARRPDSYIPRIVEHLADVLRPLGALPFHGWNDQVASVDDVFDVLRSTAKALREEVAA